MFQPVRFALIALVAAGLVACGGEKTTDTGDKKPDSGDAFPAGPDGGVVPDGGASGAAVRSLTVLGQEKLELEYGAKVEVGFLLVQTEVGAIADQKITFDVTPDPGGGKLSTTSVNTSSAGIAKVTFTAGKVAGLAKLHASAGGTMGDRPAEVLISVIPPQHSLKVTSVVPVSLASGRTEKVELTVVDKDLKPVRNASVTFTAVGPHGNVLLDGQVADSQVEVSALDGSVTLTLTAGVISAAATFDLQLTEEYSSPLSVKVLVHPRSATGGACTTSADCNAGLTCDNGVCSPPKGCLTNADCASGFTCDAAAGRCLKTVGTAGCTSTADCTGESYCNVALGKCVSGCEADAQCTAPKICDGVKNVCVAPTAQSCSVDSDCATGYVCNGSKCVATPTGPTCTSTANCAKGTYCDGNLGKCVTGCDDNSQCTTNNCNFETNQCGAKPPCTDDSQCTGGPTAQVCNQNTGNCEAPPPFIFDVTTDWMDVHQFFHATGMLPSNISSILGTIDQGFKIASTVINGNVGDLLPSWVPGFIKTAISKAVNGAINDYVPAWLKDVVRIGTNVSAIINEFGVLSEMHFAQAPPDKTVVTGTDDWKKVVYYWYTPTCPYPGVSKPPAQCAEVEIDLAQAAVAPAPAALTGKITGNNFVIAQHSVSLKYGKLINILIDKLFEAITGQPTLALALQSLIDCAGVNTFVQDTARNILPDAFKDLADNINVTSMCKSALSSGTSMITSAINNLAPITTPLSMSGRVTITQDPGNTSNVADHLINGVWDGSFNGSPSKPGFGTWNAER